MVLQGVESHPISNIQWLPVDGLSANDWNPNVVITPEFKLLRTSLLKSGWIQPILVSREPHPTEMRPKKAGDKSPPVPADQFVIIDGFHRSTLAKTDKDIRAMTGGLVPCAVLDLTKAERMMLTVRINRAKGSHVAAKMHDLVKALVQEEGVTVEDVCLGIGATKHEVMTLLTENLFKKFNVETTPYSTAWVPKANAG
jgi:hypothetical protein